jgi:hypothetical protein
MLYRDAMSVNYQMRNVMGVNRALLSYNTLNQTVTGITQAVVCYSCHPSVAKDNTVALLEVVGGKYEPGRHWHYMLQ